MEADIFEDFEPSSKNFLGTPLLYELLRTCQMEMGAETKGSVWKSQISNPWNRYITPLSPL